MQRELLRSTYFYNLPEELIAQSPVEPRDSSPLLCYKRETGVRKDLHFYDIENLLNEGDVLVVNNTRVMPARLFGFKRTGAKIEILLQKRIDLTHWEVIAKPFKRLDVGTEVIFNENMDYLHCKDLSWEGKKECK